MSHDDAFRRELNQLQEQNRLRETRAFEGADRARPRSAATKQPLLAFCSNDYLGLANHPLIAQAAADAAHTFGWGAGASRLVSGESPVHRDLERGLATFLGTADALLFPTGYQANIGVLTTLAGSADLIASDSANHASIVDGCRLSRAKVAIYQHGDVGDAERALATPGAFRRRILVTESVFSMDGDRAPLSALSAAAAARDALFVVDEAHALGIAGPDGRGVAAEAGIAPDVLVGTLGKAFGVAGGFAAVSHSLRALLINRAKTFIYTTSSPAPIAAAALAALCIISSPDGQHRRRHVHQHAAGLRRRMGTVGLSLPGQDLILPLLVGADHAALAISARLLEDGILVPAIRPPTVPEGTARLRITLSASHTDAEVTRLGDALASLAGTPVS